MSISVFNPKPQKTQPIDWAARMIPGSENTFNGNRRKPPRSERFHSQSDIREQESPSFSVVERVTQFLLPTPAVHSESKWKRFVAADFALIGLAWLLVGALSTVLRYLVSQTSMLRFSGSPQSASSLLGIALAHASLITLIGYSEGVYGRNVSGRGQRPILAKCIFWATTLLCAASVLQAVPAGVKTICSAGVLSFATLWGWRSLEQWRRRDAASPLVRNVLIAGSPSIAERLAHWLARHPEDGRSVCGILDENTDFPGGGVGLASQLATASRKGFIDELILAGPKDAEWATRLVAQARRLRLDVQIVPELFGYQCENASVETVGGLAMISVHREKLPAAGLVFKRVFDIVAASAALAITSPLLLILALLIKLDSKGSAIYSAPRAGRKGRFFQCYKFRTMVSNADDLKNSLRGQNQRSSVLFKIARDPRITRVGAILRRYSLDELPQLWNVLKGDMSMVGPRPHPVDDFAAYELEHLSRLDVMPGITGLWQVMARRDPSFERSIELDREYIRSWNLIADFRILLRTFAAVVRGSGE